MTLTPAILKNLYSAIYCMKPFVRWNMPLPEEIEFLVDKDEEIMGSYLYDTGDDEFEHTITISSARCGHLGTVIRVLCHEAIHMSRHRTNKWTHHDKEFRNRAHRISSELGFDPLEL